MVLRQFQEAFRKFYGKEFEFVKGDDTEYGEPDKLLLQTGSTLEEINSKIGNSWYFSRCSGVRIYTYGEKYGGSNWFDKRRQFRYIDHESDPSICQNWLNNVYGKEVNEDLFAKRNSWVMSIRRDANDLLRDFLNKPEIVKRGLELKVKAPNIQYTILSRNTGQLLDFAIVEIALPYPSDLEQMSMIVQFCAQTDQMYYTFRALTKEEQPALIRIENEKVLNPNDILKILDAWRELAETMI